MIIYDCEIIKAIPTKALKKQVKENLRLSFVKFCEGWEDFEGMGISVVGMYDYFTERYRVFCYDNLDEFYQRVQVAELLISYNGIKFDNKLLEANGIKIDQSKCYDILHEIKQSQYKGKHPTMDEVYTSNFNDGNNKSLDGAMAPILWQQGQIGTVIDYCLNDVRMEKMIFDLAMKTRDGIIDINGQIIRLRIPNI